MVSAHDQYLSVSPTSANVSALLLVFITQRDEEEEEEGVESHTASPPYVEVCFSMSMMITEHRGSCSPAAFLDCRFNF